MSKEKIFEAVNILKDGGVILLATDTVWGLSCIANNTKAIEKLRKIKNRNSVQPFIVLVKNDAMLERYVNAVPDIAYDIIDQSTSPVTIIYPEGVALPSEAMHPDGSIAIRVTKNQTIQRIISGLRKPILSTSANSHGKKSPKYLGEVDPNILNAVDYVLDLPNSEEEYLKASTILKIGLKGEIEIIRK